MVSCELALTEVIRSVRRSRYDRQQGRPTDDSVLAERVQAAVTLLDDIDLIVVNTSTFIRAAAFATDPDVGSLDAIHLVSAQRIGTALEAFITYDKTLARAASDCGLAVARPS